jgi:hypothetical protein
MRFVNRWPAEAGGIEPPNGGIEIRLITQGVQDSFGKDDHRQIKMSLSCNSFFVPWPELSFRLHKRSNSDHGADTGAGGSVLFNTKVF